MVQITTMFDDVGEGCWGEKEAQASKRGKEAILGLAGWSKGERRMDAELMVDQRESEEKGL